MKPQDAPGLERRRAADFERELIGRARSWIPSWSLDEAEADFGLALLKIAARFNSEVAERLDRVGEKMALGFLDWLGLPAAAARPARMPVVMNLAETATEPVLAPRPTRMQADAAGATIAFETEADLQVIPGQLAAVVAVDPAKDEYYLPPPGLTSLAELEPLPTVWKLKNFAAPRATKLQVDPGLGFVEDMLVEIEGQQFRIAAAKDDLITIEPEVPAGEGWAEGTKVEKVETFLPFDRARNLQEHVLYIGDADLLNVEAAARIEIAGLGAVPEGVQWTYWGKAANAPPTDAEARWRDLEVEQNPQPTADALVLEKPEGELETLQIGGNEGRWIRARLVTSGALKTSDKVTLRINPLPPSLDEPTAITDSDWPSLLRPEIFVNSTSSPPDSFYPLGREPRMFDTLYLGSAEAFSKPGADAWVRFELGDSTFAALSSFGRATANPVIAGVGKDGALHVFAYNQGTGSLSPYRGLEALQPPVPGGAVGSGSSAPLAFKSNWPLPIWSDGSPGTSFHIAVWSGTNIWIWDDETAQEKGRWRAWGTIPTEQQQGEVTGLIYLPAGIAQPAALIALRGQQIWMTPLTGSPAWSRVDANVSGTTIDFATLAPILDANAAEFLGTADLGLIGISLSKSLYRIAIPSGDCIELVTGGLDPKVQPAAGVDTTPEFAAVAALDGSSGLVTYDGPSGDTSPVPGTDGAIGSICVSFAGGALHFFASANAAASTKLIDLPRPNGGLFAEPFITGLPAGFGNANGGPLVLDKTILIPATEADIFVSDFDINDRIAQSGTVRPALLVPSSNTPTFLIGDVVALVGGGTPTKRLIAGNAIISGGEILYPLNQSMPTADPLPVAAYRLVSGQGLAGTFTTQDSEFKLHASDDLTRPGMWLLIDDIFRLVVDFTDPTNKPGVVTIDPAFAAGDPVLGKYYRPVTTAGQPASYLELDPGTSGNWDARLLQRAPIEFLAPLLVQRWGRAFTVDVSNRPIVVLLSAPLSAGPTAFEIDAATAEWRSVLGDSATNPELAWEYWDGESWLRIPGPVTDGTNNLRNTGTLSFTVPGDIEPVDWSGKTNSWIRARLIGGDYGKDNVSVVSKPGPGANETTQTVMPDPQAFQPPFALHVGVAYTAPATIPTFLLTLDSGSVRNQSDANRTPGAMVEIFTPLSVALGRLDASEPNSDVAEPLCVPDCDCASGTASTSPKKSPEAAAPVSASPPSLTRRALYLGFTSKLFGQPVNLLFLAAREANYDDIAPLGVHALIANRFNPIIANDETRGLGETGLLKMSFDVAPLKADLFGKSLSWLRVAPRIGSDEWKPALAGIYANAVWTRSAETMTRELLGSSDGRPDLTVALARPPLLQGSLELRVNEPLGKDECAALTAQDPNLVKQDIEDLPGIWVLWKQVPDPLDCGPNDRVYALDEGTGDVRFGDGRHGAIPPVGTDSIVAFAYERTDPAAGGQVAANFVKARQEINLVSPVEGVETVIAADRSAGGVGPEKPAHVLEFAPATLRHRGRAVSLQDFQDLVRQHSAEVVQARAFNRNGRVRIVVVTKGTDPAPTRAQQRELRRMLLEISPAALGARDVLTIAGPRTRRLVVKSDLRVSTLDVAGGVARDAKERLVTRFSTELVGENAVPWQLGRSPTEADLAETLLDIAGLDEIVSIRMFERDDLGRETPWTGEVRSFDLVMLAAEDVRVDFKLLEAAA